MEEIGLTSKIFCSANIVIYTAFVLEIKLHSKYSFNIEPLNLYFKFFKFTNFKE